MRSREKALARAGALALLFSCGGRAAAQEGRTVETINVTDARPVASAMDAIEERYGVLIDYVDPQYAAPQDTESVSYRPGRITPIPRVRTISLQYAQVAGRPEGVPYISCNADTLGCAPVTTRPEGGITALIQQVLSQFAEQGGQVFTVQKLEMPYGPRWEVYPEEARDRSGRFVFQPDVLSANIFIPKEQRTLDDMLELICQQLTSKWGHKFGIASAPPNVFFRYHGELGADNVSAWRALADLMGRTLVLRLFYAPDDGMYYVNIVNLPHRPVPRPATPARGPMNAALEYWLGHTRRGWIEIQEALTKAGFYSGPPNGAMDLKMREAFKAFQTANGLTPTGFFDHETAVKLAPFLPGP